MATPKSLVVFNPTAGAAFTATLPATSELQDGLVMRFKYIGPYSATYPITLQANTGQTIDGGASIPLVGQNASLDLVWVAALNEWLAG